MKTILAMACVMFLAMAAKAQELVYVTISSPTFAGVTVTSGTAVRVDNWLTPNSSGNAVQGVLAGRTEVLLSPPTGGQTIWWGYSVNVTSYPASNLYGTELLGGSKANPAISSVVPIYAIAADAAGAAGQRINMQQGAGGPSRPSMHIPGSP